MERQQADEKSSNWLSILHAILPTVFLSGGSNVEQVFGGWRRSWDILLVNDVRWSLNPASFFEAS
jgi:hypothetical protein